MGYKPCPICQINIIEDTKESCDLCSGKYHQEQWENYWKNRRKARGLVRKYVDRLTKGDVLSNDELCSFFGCSNQGGMRKSNTTNTLILINDSHSIYDDIWRDGVCYYTGMGLEGDQSFLEKQNRTLYNSRKSNIKVYLFECVYGNYTCIGRVELAAEPYYGTQKDRRGVERRVCIFPLKVVEGEETITK